MLPQPKHPEYGEFVLTPRETRALVRQEGWKRVVAFQTRNPLHRAHEYALVAGLETAHARRATSPAPCSTRSSARPRATTSTPLTRMQTYRALIDNKALGEGDIDEELWKKVGRTLLRST